jgi:hypothetical protein
MDFYLYWYSVLAVSSQPSAFSGNRVGAGVMPRPPGTVYRDSLPKKQKAQLLGCAFFISLRRHYSIFDRENETWWGHLFSEWNEGVEEK